MARCNGPSAGRAVPAGCGAQIWGQAQYPVHRSGTSNVQRSNLNSQRGDRNAVWWAGYGDRHVVSLDVAFGGPAAHPPNQTISCLSPYLVPTRRTCPIPVGRSRLAAAPRYGDRHSIRYTDQERSTSKVQRSTFKGLTERPHGGRDMGTDTVFGSAVVREAGQLASPTRQRFQSVQQPGGPAGNAQGSTERRLVG